jgi:hypothetical protein
VRSKNLKADDRPWRAANLQQFAPGSLVHPQKKEPFPFQDKRFRTPAHADLISAARAKHLAHTDTRTSSLAAPLGFNLRFALKLWSSEGTAL